MQFGNTKTVGWIKNLALDQTDKCFNFQNTSYTKWKLKEEM